MSVPEVKWEKICLRACFFCKLCVLKFRWVGTSLVIVGGVRLIPFLGRGMIEGGGVCCISCSALSHKGSPVVCACVECRSSECAGIGRGLWGWLRLLGN